MKQNSFFEQLADKYEFVLPDIKKGNIKEIEESDVVEIVNKSIEVAYNIGASDIHIEPRTNENVKIRFRVEGNMRDYGVLPLNYRDTLISRIKVMASMDISEKRKPQDGKMTVYVGDTRAQINLRVASFPTAGGLEDIVMRLLPNEKPLLLDSIGLNKQNLKKIVEIINKPYGMIFVCGPTGSGKTTTLHSILNYLNTSERKIWTAEDPVEITQDGLRQVQIHKFLDYATVLRSFLRGDPDVIMIGETRDTASAEIAIEASLTGHLVLTTLHTNSASETIDRLVNMGVSPFSVADSTLGVIAQRLCRTLCTRCRESYTPEKSEIVELVKVFCKDMVKTESFMENPEAFAKQLFDFWIQEYGENGELKLYKPRGCHRCLDGYRGRVGIHEVLINSFNIKRAITNRKTTDDINLIALNEGMFTLRMDGILKVLEGKIDLAQLNATVK